MIAIYDSIQSLYKSFNKNQRKKEGQIDINRVVDIYKYIIRHLVCSNLMKVTADCVMTNLSNFKNLTYNL
jgi:Ca2+-binding EF-hand superfamily protein